MEPIYFKDIESNLMNSAIHILSLIDHEIVLSKDNILKAFYYLSEKDVNHMLESLKNENYIQSININNGTLYSLTKDI